MRILVHGITKEPQAGRIRLHVQFGEEPVKSFLSDYDGSDPKVAFSSMEEELFIRLSDLAMKRYCNCAIYQMELMGITGAFISNTSLPPFPLELGTTNFGIPRPSRRKILFDRMRRPFLNAWYWWKFRHVRKENLRKYGNASNGSMHT